MNQARREHPSLLRRGLRAVLVTLMVVVPVAAIAMPAQADTYVPISGAGSTWSQNALDQWRRNVNQYGLRVNYAGTGSSDGRNQFRNGTVDFGVSEIPYGLKDNGVVDPAPQRAFAYMPIVAGGTSIMYNLRIGAKQVTNLRLSGQTLTKIFTGVITNWGDAAIKADNPGLALPARKIVPVVRSDGSGTTAQLTAYMSKQYSSLWNDYCGKVGRAVPCGLTSFYPVVPGSGFTAQSGSLGVSGYVSQAQNVGTITYVEYSYALNAGFPVVKLLNNSGYYVEPTAKSVAVALLSAQIDNTPTSPTYLTPNLAPVYNSADKRAYPMSSYSYMIVPTATSSTFDNNKGKSLGAFAYYFLCEGQQQAPILGYSPLPINLVQSGLEQVKRIPGVAAQSIDIKKCNNPTFSADGTNTLAKTAPYPTECDKAGPYQCSNGTGGAANTATPVLASAVLPAGGATTPSSPAAPGASTPAAGGTTKPPAGAGGATPGSTGTTPASGGTAPPAGGSTTDPSAGQPAAIDASSVDPGTGDVLPQSGTQTGAGDAVPLAAVPVSVAATSGWQPQFTLMLLAAGLLLAVVAGPPVLARTLSRRNEQ